MRSVFIAMAAYGTLLGFVGCGPAPQPVWNHDSRSFFYTQADGSVVQYDLDKSAMRTLWQPGERRPRQVALSPKLPFLAIGNTALGPEGRAAQLGMVSLLTGQVTWHDVSTWGDATARRAVSSNSCYWCPSGERILLWHQQAGTIPDLIQSATPFGSFVVYDVKSQKLSELTTAPPAVMLGQAIHVSPLCPDGSGYLAMKLADDGPRFFFVTWEGWEYPLVPTAEVDSLLKRIGDAEVPNEQRMQTLLPLPQGRWTDQVLSFPTRYGVVQLDLKQRTIQLAALPDDLRREFAQISAADAADPEWTTLQAATLAKGDLAVHYRRRRGDAGGAVHVELVDTQRQGRRVLLKGLSPENFLVHHLFPSPDGQRLLVCLRDARTGAFCIHVVQADGTEFANIDTGRLEGGNTVDE